MWCFAMLLKSLMQKVNEPNHEISIYANFSYVCAPKPAGRVDPSRLEGVKAYSSSIPVRENFMSNFMFQEMRLPCFIYIVMFLS